MSNSRRRGGARRGGTRQGGCGGARLADSLRAAQRGIAPTCGLPAFAQPSRYTAAASGEVMATQS